MAVICRNCLINKGMNVPAVRTRRAPCDFCGRDDEVRGGRTEGMNFDYPDHLLPGHPNEPNAVAEREEQMG